MNTKKGKINVGIGFVTGRKNFKNVVKAYLDSWNQSSPAERKQYALHLFVAYDLKYMGTEANDYKITDEGILGTVDSAHYLGAAAIATEARLLTERGVLAPAEAKLLFGEGYAMKRNAVLYFALKSKMDYLIFLDDDEYPIANIKMDGSTVWKGQEVLSTHLLNLPHADMTHGHHCGYISPLPKITFSDTLREDDFRVFIEAISNDIINWGSVKQKMDDGGVTYAELDVINSEQVEIIKEVQGMKFISGANLGFRLKQPDKLFPFYNPPGARGEDTFLSTCIGACEIRKVPCYTFHDSFLAYPGLLSGVLPNRLRTMDVGSGTNYKRFLRACVGWIRYKPLLTYITRREDYAAEMANSRRALDEVIPKLCAYFGNDDFKGIVKEFSFFQAHVEAHYQDFARTKDAWIKAVRSI